MIKRCNCPKIWKRNTNYGNFVLRDPSNVCSSSIILVPGRFQNSTHCLKHLMQAHYYKKQSDVILEHAILDAVQDHLKKHPEESLEL